MKAKFYVSGESLPEDVIIKEIEVDQEFMIDLFLDYLTIKDLHDILEGIYNDVDAKAVIEEIVLPKIDDDAAKWTINIEPHIWPYPKTPAISELEYKVNIQTPARSFDLDELGGTDDDIKISAEIMDQFIKSFKKKELDAAFYDKYMDYIAHHPEHHK